MVPRALSVRDTHVREQIYISSDRIIEKIYILAHRNGKRESPDKNYPPAPTTAGNNSFKFALVYLYSSSRSALCNSRLINSNIGPAVADLVRPFLSLFLYTDTESTSSPFKFAQCRSLGYHYHSKRRRHRLHP